jgi:outer membrane protein OmpA-like peptidoglycan-associated protein
VFFDFDSIELTDGARSTLDTVASSYASCGSPSVVVTGHTDRAGSVGYNAKLSLRRAEVVKAYLAERKVGEMITTVAKGEVQPLVPTADGVRNPQNRRVEIVYEEETAPSTATVEAVAPTTK